MAIFYAWLTGCENFFWMTQSCELLVDDWQDKEVSSGWLTGLRQFLWMIARLWDFPMDNWQAMEGLGTDFLISCVSCGWLTGCGSQAGWLTQCRHDLWMQFSDHVYLCKFLPTNEQGNPQSLILRFFFHFQISFFIPRSNVSIFASIRITTCFLGNR